MLTVIVIMGSGADAVHKTVETLVTRGEKVVVEGPAVSSVSG
jgi:hypothetical protein